MLKGLKKVQQNPFSQLEDGYGKSLENKNGNDLSGFLKIIFEEKTGHFDWSFFIASNIDMTVKIGQNPLELACRNI